MGACLGRAPKKAKRTIRRVSKRESLRPSELQLKVMGETLSGEEPKESVADFLHLNSRAKNKILELYVSSDGNVSHEEIEELQEDYDVPERKIDTYFESIRTHEKQITLRSNSSFQFDSELQINALSPESPTTPRISLREQLFPEIFGEFEKFSEEVLEGQYELVMELGSGAHGQVYMAKTTKKNLILPAGKLVAIKQMDNIFQQAYKAKCVVREMRAERYFGGHECITKLVDVIIPKPHNLNQFQSILLVFEYMECALDEHIENPDINWSENDVKQCMEQLLMGVKYLHTGKFVHRDLKPENILLNPLDGGFDYKLADFGLCRCFGKNDKRPSIESKQMFVPPEEPTLIKFTPQLTKRVVTRYYRAPEVSLLMQNRNELPKVDIWSLGCILGELIQLIPGNESRADETGSEIFFHGAADLVLSPKKGVKKISKNQLIIIFDMLGKPSKKFINQISNEHIRKWVRARPKTKPQDLEKMFPAVTKECVDLLRGMLKYDPKERLSADQCLNHPWLATAEDKPQNITHEPIIEDYEDVYLNDYELRLMVVDEILYYHPEWKEHLQYRKLAANASKSEFAL